MKHWLGSLVTAAFLIFAPAAQAANSTVPAMTAATSVVGTDLFYCVQSAGTLDRKCTPAQMAAYIYGLMSGDATASGTGALTLATVNSNVGSFGSATNCVSITTNGKGLITAASATTCTPAIASVTGLGTGVATALAIAPGTTGSFTTQDGAIVTGNCLKWGPGVQDAGAACGTGGTTFANPTATAGPTAINGTATTAMRSDGAPAVQLGTGSAPGLVQCGLGLTCTAGVAGSQVTQRNNTATTDTLLSTDAGTVVTESNASAVAVGIAVATTSGFGTGQYWTVKNKGAGLVTITPTTSTIDGAATLTLVQNQSVDFYSDGANYWTLPGRPTMPCAGLTGGTTCGTPVGTIVGTVTTQSGTTYTFANSDCGTTVRFTNAGAVTATIPTTLTTNCVIAVEQAAAGQVAVNGSAVTPATLHSAHSYTKTFGQWAMINLFMESSGVVVLTGDGA